MKEYVSKEDARGNKGESAESLRKRSNLIENARYVIRLECARKTNALENYENQGKYVNHQNKKSCTN